MRADVIRLHRKEVIMDLTPLYELRERLKTSAIAGTTLMEDDFRLKRALEGFTP